VAFELPTTIEDVHAGGIDRSPLAGLSGVENIYLNLTGVVYVGDRSFAAAGPRPWIGTVYLSTSSPRPTGRGLSHPH